MLPTEPEAATFLSALQSVSNISGIDLKAWSPMEEIPQTFYAKVPMKLQITGRFHQIAKFVYEVGKQDRAGASAARNDAGSRGQGPRRDAPRREQQSASNGGGALADALRRAAEKNAGNGKSR